jgi:hypothetical protein
MIDMDNALYTATAGQYLIFVNHREWRKWIVDRM